MAQVDAVARHQLDMSAHLHVLRGPMGSSTKGPSGRGRMAQPRNFGTPHTRFVAPQGAPPAAPVAAVA